jgi:transcriptional regulator with XRE-family HTH domain
MTRKTTKTKTKPKSIGQRIREMREVRGISQDVLAARSGVAQPHLSQLEIDTHSPNVKTLEALMSALDSTLGEFFADGVWDAKYKKYAAEHETLQVILNREGDDNRLAMLAMLAALRPKIRARSTYI